MANTYKNIVITPNTGSSTGDPTIVFSGANANVNTDITMRVYPTSNGTLSIEGSVGQLFSVTNDLSNTIFSVNDISGLPLIEVNVRSQQVTFGQYYGNVGIGTLANTSSIYKLDVAGSANISSATLLVAGQNVLSAIAAGNTLAYSYANTTQGAAQSYTNTMTGVANVWANTVAGYSNTWANTQYGNSLAYANSVGTGANNQAGLMANAANSSASSTYLPLSGGTLTGSLVINQNLTVSGTTTYVNTQSLLIGDSVVVLNADLPSTATPTENAGIEINRGNSNSNSAIVWVESAQKWYITSNTWAGNNNWIASNADLAVLGVGANNQAGLMANAANSAATTREGYSNNWANTVAGISNTWANTVAGYSNTWANTVAGISNTWANTQYGNSLTYANAVGTGSNNYAITVGAASNTWANTVSGYSNTWANTKLSNTSGVSFAGNLYFPSGSLGVGTSNPRTQIEIIGPSTYSALTFNVAAGVANTRVYDIIATTSNTIGYRLVNEAYTAATTYYIINRELMNISSQIWYAGAGIEALRINNTGNVGIGTTTVGEPLTVARNATNNNSSILAGTVARFIGPDGTQSRIILDAYGAGTNMSFRHASGTAATPTATSSGSGIIGINGFGYGTTGYTTSSRASFNALAAETWTDSAQGTYINFQTTAIGTTTTSEKVRIDASGNVGIGTINPVFKLDVNGNMKANSVYGSSLGDGILNLYSTSSSAGPNWTDAITFNTINAGKVLEIDSWGGMWTGIVPSPKPFNYTGASTTMWSYYDFSFTYPQSAINWNTYVTSGVYRRIAAGHVAIIVPSSDGAITFLTNNITAAANTTVVPNERMRISNTGNVGIGTSNPIYKLDVAGTLNVSSGGAIAGGFTVDSFNAGANIAAYGTWTPNPTNGNYQYVTSNGSVTIAVPTSNCAIDVLWYNGIAAGSVTLSGFTAPTGGGGDTYATTNANKYILMIRRINGVSTYSWKALQ